MSSCRLPAYISYFTIAYFIASILYLIITYAAQFGTPFSDSLTAQQRKLKSKSDGKRGIVFVASFSVCLIILFVFQPFTKPQ